MSTELDDRVMGSRGRGWPGPSGDSSDCRAREGQNSDVPQTQFLVLKGWVVRSRVHSGVQDTGSQTVVP